MTLRAVCAALVLVSVGHSAEPASAGAPVGQTRIARWKDDKQAAILLMFDDSSSTHVKYVLPELKKRGLIATFYVNPGNERWRVSADAWEREIPAAGMEYGNHTMTHRGVRDVADAEQEIRQSNETIMRLVPGSRPRLISWGQPGIKKEAWNISDQQLNELLAKHHLVPRPPVDNHAAVTHLKTAADLDRLVDTALETGGVEHVIFHGVGGDWIVFPLPEFTAFLDRLAAEREHLWVTGHMPAHMYQTERDTAEVRVLESSNRQMRLELLCKADPKLYDFPLTLVTRVPDEWKQCQVAQGANTEVVLTSDGLIRYDAVPNAGPITIRPVGSQQP